MHYKTVHLFNALLKVMVVPTMIIVGFALVDVGPIVGNKAFASCAECTSECRTEGRWECWGSSGQICAPCGYHPGGVCSQVGSGYMQASVCRYCLGPCTISPEGNERESAHDDLSSSHLLEVAQNQDGSDDSKVAFRLEFSTADSRFIKLARELPTHAAVLLAYWFDSVHRPIPLFQTKSARYGASPELSELYALRAIKHAESPELIAKLMDEPPSVNYQLALPKTEEVEVDLTRMSEGRLGLSIASYRASDEAELAQTLVMAQETKRSGHYEISSVESTKLQD